MGTSDIMNKNIKIWLSIVVVTLLLSVTADNLHTKISEELTEKKVSLEFAKEAESFFSESKTWDKSEFDSALEIKEEVQKWSFSIRSKNIVYTNKTFFQDVEGIKMGWNDASNHCANLSFNNSSNWYLPNKDEFLALYLVEKLNDYMGVNYEINKLFKNIVRENNFKKDNYYWTSTVHKGDGLGTSALSINTNTHTGYEVWNKNIKYRVICATKDNIVDLDEPIFTYGNETSANMIMNHKKKIVTLNKTGANKLNLMIKKCTDAKRSWRFDSKGEVVCEY